MTAEKCLKLLKEKCKKIKKENKEIFDILLYGSKARGKRKANDIDILIIFQNKSLQYRLKKLQEFKSQFLEIKNLDVKSINLKEFFDKNFLARQGILIEGKSLIKNKNFSERFGLKGFALFSYAIKNLTNSEKTRFIFTLNGRRHEKGLLKKINAKRIGSGAIMIPIENSEIFSEFLKKWKISFNTKKILVEDYK